MSENQPREYDAVLGGDSQAPVDGVVLGGIEGIKQRLANPDIKVKIAGLYQALNYGDAGLDLIIKALRDEEKEVKKAAYSILKERKERRVIQKLEKYSRYQIFDCISTLEGHESNIHSVCIAPDREKIISGSEDSVIVWDWQKKQFIKIFTSEVDLSNYPYEYISFVCINYSRETIYIRSNWGNIIGLNWKNTEVRNVLHKEEHGLHHSLNFSRNGDVLFIGKRSGSIKVWDIPHQKLKCIFQGYSKPIFSLVAYGKTLFSSTEGYTIQVWDWQERKELIRNLLGHKFWIKALCISPDGKTLFSGSGDYTIRIWDWQKGESIRILKGHSLGINSLVISPDGKTLISASNDTTIKIWNWRTGRLQATLTGHSAEVNSIVLSPDGKYLFSGSSDKTVKVWGLE